MHTFVRSVHKKRGKTTQTETKTPREIWAFLHGIGPNICKHFDQKAINDGYLTINLYNTVCFFSHCWIHTFRNNIPLCHYLYSHPYVTVMTAVAAGCIHIQLNTKWHNTTYYLNSTNCQITPVLSFIILFWCRFKTNDECSCFCYWFQGDS